MTATAVQVQVHRVPECHGKKCERAKKKKNNNNNGCSSYTVNMNFRCTRLYIALRQA